MCFLTVPGHLWPYSVLHLCSIMEKITNYDNSILRNSALKACEMNSFITKKALNFKLNSKNFI